MKPISIVLLTLLCSCTISFQNVSTNGKADDLIDEEQTSSPKVDAAVKLPVLP